MNFLILLNIEKNENKKVNKDRLFFIIYSILTQDKQTEILISDIYQIFRDYDNEPLLKQIENLSKYAKNFKIEWKNQISYYVINIEYKGKN